MPRRSRISIPGRFYHIMLRGNNGEDIFFHVEDRCKLSLLLQEGTERFGYKIHAFAFMSNHIHLAIQVGEIPISKIVHNFSFRYSAYINRRYGRVGHIFQGRFKSILLDAEGYLLRLVRYIHLNPLRAGLVCHLEDYRWTSHQSYLNVVHSDFIWVTTNMVLNIFGSDYQSALRRYQIYLSQDQQEDDKLFRKGFQNDVLGDEGFIDSLQESLETTKELNSVIPIKDFLGLTCQYFSVSHQDLKVGNSHKISRIRAIVSILTIQQPYLTLEELAKEINRKPCTLSNLVRRFKEKEKKDLSFAEEIHGFKNFLSQN